MFPKCFQSINEVQEVPFFLVFEEWVVCSSPIFRINLLRKSLENSRLFSFVLMKFFVTLCYTAFELKTLAKTSALSVSGVTE